MTIQQLLQNHRNVIGYLAGLADVLVRVSSTTLTTDALVGEVPEAVDPEAVVAEVAEVQAEMSKMATVLRGAAEVLMHPGVTRIAVLEATSGGHEQQDPEALLTTRKRAQA
jgi:hypothetical protein